MPAIMTRPTMQMTTIQLLERGAKLFPNTEIISWCSEKKWRFTYSEYYERIRRLANVLNDFGIQRGEKIATIGMNTHRHSELYLALPCIGSIIHPVNPMLFKEQLVHIINHADDKVLFVDDQFIPLAESLMDELTSIEKYVIMTDLDKLPETKLSPVYSYDELLEKASPDYDFSWDFDEFEATVLSYSSGTTGMPRGYLYNHRCHVISAMMMNGYDHFDIREEDVIMTFVPLFHACGWNLAYACVGLGIKQVLVGPHMDPGSLCSLIEEEKVSWLAGVPTVFIGVLDVAEREGRDISSIRRALVAGAPSPPYLLDKLNSMGIRTGHGYGTTESSGPSLTLSQPKMFMKDWPKEKLYAQMGKQGISVVGMELRALNGDGNEIKWDAKEQGELWMKSACMNIGYLNDPERTADIYDDGWMNTQDIITRDEYGYIKIVDRSKDIIKSGGEWISSLDLENLIMSHPDVLEATVFAIPSEKWQERPMAWVVPREEFKDKLTKDDIMTFLQEKTDEGKMAKWWLPDEIKLVDAIPKTGTLKFDKKAIRKQYWDK